MSTNPILLREITSARPRGLGLFREVKLRGPGAPGRSGVKGRTEKSPRRASGRPTGRWAGRGGVLGGGASGGRNHLGAAHLLANRGSRPASPYFGPKTPVRGLYLA